MGDFLPLAPPWGSRVPEVSSLVDLLSAQALSLHLPGASVLVVEFRRIQPGGTLQVMGDCSGMMCGAIATECSIAEQP